VEDVLRAAIEIKLIDDNEDEEALERHSSGILTGV